MISIVLIIINKGDTEADAHEPPIASWGHVIDTTGFVNVLELYVHKGIT